MRSQGLMRILCLLGLHLWKYLEVFMVIPGMARRLCLRCGRIDYHEETK